MNFAIVGATGLVGRKMLELLGKESFVNPENLTLFASSKSAGQFLLFKNKQIQVQELCENNIKKYDYVLFSAGGSISKKYAKYFTQKGAYVIDNSSAFRRKKRVPLIVPEINFDSLNNSKIIANPNCSTIGASLPIFAISKKYEINRIVISTYQAVSGAGQKGIIDLENNTCNKFNYNINNNLIPHIDYFLKNNYTYEENKMEFELKKILNNKELKITTTCVRVPIKNCHSEALNIEFNKKPNLNIIKKLLQNTPSIILYDNPQNNEYPMPIIADGKNEVFVGRLRYDTSNKYAINMFICFDNILKGAALNAVQILKKLLELKNK